MSPPAWAIAAAVSRIIASLSTEHGPGDQHRLRAAEDQVPNLDPVPSGARRRSTSGMSGFLLWCAGVGGGADSRLALDPGLVAPQHHDPGRQRLDLLQRLGHPGVARRRRPRPRRSGRSTARSAPAGSAAP